ncbi:unnamed protein product, partial [Prorocentrum cordatum]
MCCPSPSPGSATSSEGGHPVEQASFALGTPAALWEIQSAGLRRPAAHLPAPPPGPAGGWAAMSTAEGFSTGGSDAPVVMVEPSHVEPMPAVAAAAPPGFLSAPASMARFMPAPVSMAGFMPAADFGDGGSCCGSQNNWAGFRGLVFYPQPRDSRSGDSYAYHGDGKGAYERVESYKYVGHGCGSFDREEVAQPHFTWQPRKCCICCLLLLCALPFLLGSAAWARRSEA